MTLERDQLFDDSVRAADTTSGLTEADAAALLRRYGPNVVRPPRPPGVGRKVAGQLADPLIALLLVSMTVTVALRDVTDSIVIGLVILVNTLVGVLQEIRADQAVAALNKLSAPAATVIRDGVERRIDAAALVPGDQVLLASGDVVPADLQLVDAIRLTVNEAALTGESMPVHKTAGNETAGEVLAGTVVVEGRGSGTVMRTGPLSALGHITVLVAHERRSPTPLQRRLTRLGRTLGLAAVSLSAVVTIGGVLRGVPLGEMVLAGVSLVVAAVPESLPAVVTVTLALGARRMARHNAIVRRLPAVETLGSVTTLAVDKTGTLTEGRMTCTLVATASARVDPKQRAILPADVENVLRDLILCNDAVYDIDRAGWSGDPVEVALLEAAEHLGATKGVRQLFPRVAEIPFEAGRRRMTTVHRDPSGGFLTVSKGAPEALLHADGPLTDLADELSQSGHRVLAVAEGRSESPTITEAALEPVGLVALADPVRPAAATVVQRFVRAGIRLVMITGDHPATARAVAVAVGMPDPVVATHEALVTDGTDAYAADVFARTRPEQKMDIIRALQDRGQVVAMTGDGVNDAPALRRADIGAAMGRGGTEVARQAADLILADDNLITLGAAVEEGRRIYANIRRFLVYGLSGGLAEILIMLVGPFLGLPLPLLPVQILWINLLTHGLPGVALGAEPVERGAMDRPPRGRDQAILGGVVPRIMVTGTLIAAVSLGAALITAAAGGPWQTTLFLVLGLAQLGVGLSVRARRPRGVPPNRAFSVAVALSAALLAAAVAVPALRTLLGTAVVGVVDAVVVMGACVVPGAVMGLLTRLPRSESE